MQAYMFRSRMGALLFAVLTLFGVATLVGDEDEDGAIQRAADRFEQQNADRQRSAGTLASTQNTAPVAIEATPPDAFASDEDLIDDAAGLDTSGIDASGFEPEGIDPSPDTEPSPIAADEPEEVILIVDEVPAP